MTKEEQVEFVNGLTDTVKGKIIESIESGKVPEDWNGLELRWLIADKFAGVVWSDDKRRSREFKNTCIVNNI